MTDVDPEVVRVEHRYEKLTWPEINEAIAQNKVVVLPVGSIEQHGYHLPIDVDVRSANTICQLAGAASPEDMLVLPPFTYGYCNHVMDFPGTITIQPDTFVRALVDRATVPVVVDADGLNAFAGWPQGLAGREGRDVIITPHPGEMARLLGVTIEEVQANRLAIARQFAETHRVYVVLKGHRTMIATPDGTVYYASLAEKK